MKRFPIQVFIDALAEENRLRILHALRKKPLCVSEICGGLKLPQNLVSHHLEILHEVQLLQRRKEGRKIYYSINRVVLQRKTKQLHRFLRTV